MTAPPSHLGSVRKVHVARVLFQALLPLAGLAVFWLIGRSLGGYVPQFAGWVRGLGAWGPAVFILGYAAAAVGVRPRLAPHAGSGCDLWHRVWRCLRLSGSDARHGCGDGGGDAPRAPFASGGNRMSHGFVGAVRQRCSLNSC